MLHDSKKNIFVIIFIYNFQYVTERILKKFHFEEVTNFPFTLSSIYIVKSSLNYRSLRGRPEIVKSLFLDQPQVCLQRVFLYFYLLPPMAAHLKYQFWKKSLGKNVTLSSWTLFQHICPHFWAWLLFYSAITPKSEDKYSTELHFSEVYFVQNWYFSSMVKKLGTVFRWNFCEKEVTWHSIFKMFYFDWIKFETPDWIFYLETLFQWNVALCRLSEENTL